MVRSHGETFSLGLRRGGIVTAAVTAASPVDRLEPYVRSRLNPLDLRDWPEGAIRSDFDLHDAALAAHRHADPRRRCWPPWSSARRGRR